MLQTSLRWSRGEAASSLPVCLGWTQTSGHPLIIPTALDLKDGVHRVVHAEQTIKILKPFPKHVDSKDGWKLVRSIGGVHDKGSWR